MRSFALVFPEWLLKGGVVVNWTSELPTFKANESESGVVEFLRTTIQAAIKEYRQVWMAEPRI